MSRQQQDTPHKKCFKCGATLPLTEFYKHPQMGDGHLNKCKECTKRDTIENRAKRRKYYSDYDRKRYQKHERREQKNQYIRIHRAKQPLKYKARHAITNAVRDGKIQKEPCFFCGSETVEAHHHDYNKPFDVTWVCFKCHREQFHDQVVTVER